MSPIKLAVVLLSGASLLFYTYQHGLPQPSTNPSGKTLSATAQLSSTGGDPMAAPDSADLVKVTRVIDGDTIQIEDGRRVRYIGINAPETVDPRTAVQCYGVEASNANKSLVEGQQVRLEKDISETDKYGRLLRYVWIGDTMVNESLLRDGFAAVSTYPPDVKYLAQFNAAQEEARSSSRGLWGSCTSASSPVTKPQTAAPSLSPPDPACPIKGNISSSGKIYHLPGQRYYDKTIIDLSAGERWFCSEAEAVTAGWRKSKL